MSELIDTGSGVTPRRTNRSPLGSPGTDMGSGMMGDPTMGNPMFGRTMMPGYGFMSEIIDTGSGVTPRGPRRDVIGSPGTDMGSGMMGDPTMGMRMLGGMTNPTSAVTQLMGNNSPMASTANMGLPFSSNLPIDVNENTSNLEEIQNFPVVGRTPNGIHFHQDPITGQMYRMTEILHQRIPMILSSKKISPIELKNYTLENTSGLPSAKPMPIISINGKPIQTNLGNFNTNLNSVYSGYDIFQPDPVKNYSIDLVSNKKFTDINVVSKIQIGQIEQTNLNNQLVSNVAEPTQKITKISTLVNPNVQNITTDILVKPQKITKLSDFSNKNIESTSVRVFNLERKLTKIKSFI